jgi:hypothetical protein
MTKGEKDSWSEKDNDFFLLPSKHYSSSGGGTMISSLLVREKDYHTLLSGTEQGTKRQ